MEVRIPRHARETAARHERVAVVNTTSRPREELRARFQDGAAITRYQRLSEVFIHDTAGLRL